MTFENVNPCKLNDEFRQAGIEVVLMTFEGNEASVIFGEDVDMNKVNEVIESHNSEPILAPKTEMEILKERQELMQQAIDELILGGAL